MLWCEWIQAFGILARRVCVWVCVCVCVFRTGLPFYSQKYFSCWVFFFLIDKLLISTLGQDLFLFYEKKYFTC